VLEGLRGEENISELCRHEGIAASMYYGWSKEFLEAGKRRLAGDTARAATSGEVKDLRREAAIPPAIMTLNFWSARRRCSAVNTIVVTSWSEECRGTANGEPSVFYPRPGFAGTILASLFESFPSNFCTYSFHRNIS
jgi:transposase-like protein